MPKVSFTNLDKIFFPKTGYTKNDLVIYYQGMADIIMPYLKNRPHNLLRQPGGIGGESFFQKDMDHIPPDWVQTKSIYSQSNKENVNYLVCNSKDTLLYMVQLGCVEINPWNSRLGHLQKPDWLVIDLDPEKIDFKYVVKTAKIVKQVCDELDIPSYPKTSGKTGIHIFIPLAAKYTYNRVRQSAKVIAGLVNDKVPDYTSLLRLPEKRQGRVYVDWLQNSQGQTLAAPYSVRPTDEASISTPLHWDEVDSKLNPKKFTVKTIQKRIDKVGDLWKPVLGRAANLEKILVKTELRRELDK